MHTHTCTSTYTSWGTHKHTHSHKLQINRAATVLYHLPLIHPFIKQNKITANTIVSTHSLPTAFLQLSHFRNGLYWVFPSGNSGRQVKSEALQYVHLFIIVSGYFAVFLALFLPTVSLSLYLLCVQWKWTSERD